MQLSRHYAAIANRVIKENGDAEVGDLRVKVMEALGVEGLTAMSCEAINEVDRRAALAKRRAARKERKQASAFGHKFERNRRIISVAKKSGREVVFHATKGPRYYRLET